MTNTTVNIGGKERHAAEKPHQVLIVDSSVKELQELAAAFRRLGFAPLEATTFDAATRLWIAHQPPVLISDIRLGQFNGLQLLLRAKANRPDVRAVITCAFLDRVLEAETLRFGGAFMVKPVTAMKLVATLGIRPEEPMLTDRRMADRRRMMTPALADERRVRERRRPAS